MAVLTHTPVPLWLPLWWVPLLQLYIVCSVWWGILGRSGWLGTLGRFGWLGMLGRSGWLGMLGRSVW